MPLTEPWSKKHKKVTRSGGLPFNLSNSYAQPLTHQELIGYSLARGDRELVEAYNDHELGYTANGGSLDLREEIAKLYGPKIQAENILVFTGAQVALPTAAMALREVCKSKPHAIVFTPGYQSVQESPIHADFDVTKIRLKLERNWQIDPREVEAAVRSNTKYMVVNEPYNPAGCSFLAP